MKVIHLIAGIDKTGGGTTDMRLLEQGKKNTELMADGLKPTCIEGVEVKFFNYVFDGIPC
jgi:hypothetical protein